MEKSNTVNELIVVTVTDLFLISDVNLEQTL